jgi:hypothetical protein
MPIRAQRRKRPQLPDLFGNRQPRKANVCPLEEAEQIALFQWRDVAVKSIPELRWLHSSLNGVPLSPGLAVKMRRMGMTKGVVDVFLPVVRNGYSGLYIEMKRRNGVKSDLSDAQSEFIDFAREQGYRAGWCKGWEPARDMILNYLEATK